MAKSVFNVKRGMVFWYDPSPSQNKFNPTVPDANGKLRKSFVQAGHRPYVVVSCDDGNISSPTCNIAPITSEDKTKIPVHVDVYFNGNMNTILCEQIITVDQFVLKDFICFLTDSTLEKIEEAISIQYQIRPKVRYTDFELDNIIGSLEKVVERIIDSKKIKAAQPDMKVIEDTALRLGQMIEDLVGGVPDKDVKENKPVEKGNATTDSLDEIIPDLLRPELEPATKAIVSTPAPVAKEQTPIKKQPQPIVIKKTSGVTRVKWDDDKRREYLADCDKLGPEEIMVKWGLSTAKSVYSTKYLCRNYLKMNGGMN